VTPHFSLEELTYSYTATRLGIDNTPNEEQKANLLILSEGLELVRTKLNSLPISINSGFRCEKLNDVLGSRRTSKLR
jgi:zinc D-Ala-D-Ala carboxypeptidase